MKTIWSIENDVILQAEKGGALNDNYKTVDDLLKFLFKKVHKQTKESGKFDLSEFNNDFYDKPIKEFKKLFHN